jgi:hypothetical protein
MPLSLIGTRPKNRRLAVIAATTCAVSVLTTAGAAAYFTTSGTGSGTATVGLGTTVRSVAATATTGLLYPSTTYKGTLHLTLTATTNAKVTGVAVDPSRLITVSGGLGGTPACAGSHITIDGSTGLNFDLTANTASTRSIPGVVAMKIDAPNSCQGATFTVPVILTAQEN